MINCVSISTTCILSHRRVSQHHRWRPSFSLPATSFSSYQSLNHAFRIQKLWSTTSSLSSPAAAIPFDISPPPIDHDFLGPRCQMIGERKHLIMMMRHYVQLIVALCSFPFPSGFNCHEVSGDDRLQFLHNQSTANFEVLREGEGCDTVFVTPTARTIDIAHAWVMKTAVTLVVSPLTSGSISEMLKKYIFFADKVEIEDISDKTCLFVLVGPRSNQVVKDLGLGELIGQPYGSHKHYSVSGKPITVAVGNVISEEGFSLLMPPDAARLVWKGLVSQGATPMGSKAWETLRILQGRPAPGKELTDEFNVLEAGLWNSISLNKGCYKGQETISRLVTYEGVKQNLWGIRLSSSVEPGSPITVDGKKVGKLTSYATGRNESEHFGLGYIKKRAASKGDKVIVGEGISGTVVEVPYLARQRPLSMKSKS